MENNSFLHDMGSRLKARRKELNFTQQQMAEALKLSLNFYGSIERGEKRMSLEKLLLAFEKLDIDPTYLLTGTPREKFVLSELFNDCPKDKIFDMEQIVRYASNLYRE